MAATVVATLALAACGSSATDQNIPEAATSNSDISQFVDAVKANDMEGTLNGTGPFTVFAPTNSAMDAASDVTMSADVIKVHVIEGQNLSRADLEKGVKNASMLDGNDIVTYTGSDGKLYMNSMEVVGEPIEAKNGTIYMISGVNKPKE